MTSNPNWRRRANYHYEVVSTFVESMDTIDPHSIADEAMEAFVWQGVQAAAHLLTGAFAGLMAIATKS